MLATVKVLRRWMILLYYGEKSQLSRFFLTFLSHVSFSLHQCLHPGTSCEQEEARIRSLKLLVFERGWTRTANEYIYTFDPASCAPDFGFTVHN